MIVVLVLLSALTAAVTRRLLRPIEERWVAFWFRRWERQGKL